MRGVGIVVSFDGLNCDSSKKKNFEDLNQVATNVTLFGNKVLDDVIK